MSKKYKSVKIIIETEMINGQQLDKYNLEIENMSMYEIKTACGNVIRGIDKDVEPKVIERTDGF